MGSLAAANARGKPGPFVRLRYVCMYDNVRRPCELKAIFLLGPAALPVGECNLGRPPLRNASNKACLRGGGMGSRHPPGGRGGPWVTLAAALSWHGAPLARQRSEEWSDVVDRQETDISSKFG